MEEKQKEVIKIGYARVSTTKEEQVASLESQIEKLKEYGCSIVYSETKSGKRDDRKEYNKALKKVKELARDKDVKVILVVYRGDRFGRNFKELVTKIDDLNKKGIGFKSLTESYDTSTIEGMLMFQLLSSIYDYETSNMSLRIKNGMEKARKDGKRIGKQRNLEKEREILDLYKTDLTIKEIAKRVNYSEKGVYLVARRHGLSRR